MSPANAEPGKVTEYNVDDFVELFRLKSEAACFSNAAYFQSHATAAFNSGVGCGLSDEFVPLDVDDSGFRWMKFGTTGWTLVSWQRVDAGESNDLALLRILACPANVLHYRVGSSEAVDPKLDFRVNDIQALGPFLNLPIPRQ